MNGTIRFSKRIPKAAGEQEEAQQKLSSAAGSVGFLLLDSTLSPMFVSAEALRILAYPGHQEDTPRLAEFLEGVIRSLDLKPHGNLEKNFVKRFMSGKRHYTGRLFPLSPCGRNPQQPMMAFLIDRDPVSADLLEMAEKLNLTRREYEAVQHLSLGLTSKQIAARMGISINTVKAFLSHAMIKAGVTNRSGMIGKFLKTT